MTFWDLDADGRAPGLRGQLHVILLDNDGLTDDDVYVGCDSAATFELVSITSNEAPESTGDGTTISDVHGASVGTPDTTFQLRAERSGTGTGRIYTIVSRATDAAGNARQATATVTVPLHQ